MRALVKINIIILINSIYTRINDHYKRVLKSMTFALTYPFCFFPMELEPQGFYLAKL